MTFRKASKCEAANCVEVDTDGATVLVRDSKDLGGPVLSFHPSAWPSGHPWPDPPPQPSPTGPPGGPR